jgi:ribosomal protein S14
MANANSSAARMPFNAAVQPLPQIEIKCDEDRMYAQSTRKRGFYVRGTIGCARCGHPIHIYKVAGLSDEFSLRCSHCGARGFYARHTLLIEQMPERRRRPRN